MLKREPVGAPALDWQCKNCYLFTTEHPRPFNEVCKDCRMQNGEPQTTLNVAGPIRWQCMSCYVFTEESRPDDDICDICKLDDYLPPTKTLCTCKPDNGLHWSYCAVIKEAEEKYRGIKHEPTGGKKEEPTGSSSPSSTSSGISLMRLSENSVETDAETTRRINTATARILGFGRCGGS